MGSAQIALDPLCQTGKCGKKCPKPSLQALAPQANMGQRSAPNHPGKPSPPSPLRAMLNCPYGNNTFQKGASLG